MTEEVIGCDGQIPLHEESYELDVKLLSLSENSSLYEDNFTASEAVNNKKVVARKSNKKKGQKTQAHHCLECGLSFRQKRTLQKHLLQHIKLPSVRTARCDRSELYSDALRRSNRINGNTKPQSAPGVGGSLILKIKLDGSGTGKSFEVVPCGDERSRDSCASSGSDTDEETVDKQHQEYVTAEEEETELEQSQEQPAPEETSCPQDAAADVTTDSVASANETSGSLNDPEEETLASLLSKSIGNSADASVSLDPFDGILQEEQEQERVAGIRPLSPVKEDVTIKNSPYYPSVSPTIPCRLAQNVMVELNSPHLSTSGTPSPAFPSQSPGQPQTSQIPATDTSTSSNTTEQDSNKLLQQMLNGDPTDQINQNLSEPPNEYMSLDKLPMQHTCAVCGLGFPELCILEEHCRTHGHGSALPYTQLQTPAQQAQQAAAQHNQYGAQQQYGGSSQQQQQQYPPAYPPYGQLNVPYGQPPVPMEQLAQQVRNLPLPAAGQQQLPHNNMGIRYMTQPHMMPQQPQQQQVTSQQQQQPPLQQYPITPNQPGQPGQPGQHPQQQQQYVRMGQTYRMQRPNVNGGYPPQYYPGQQPGQRGQYTRYPQPRGGVPNGYGRGLPPGRHMLPPTRGNLGPGRPLKRTNTQPSRSVVSSSTNSTATTGGPKLRKMSDLLIPGAHESDDCSLISVQDADVSLPVIQNVQGNSHSTPTFPKEAIRLSDQITLSVRNKEPAIPKNVPRGKEANAVANILASRGITVTTGNGGRRQNNSDSDQQDVSLNLNNAVSIIPTNKNKAVVATVDLTDDPPPAKEVFAAGSKLLSCHVCNKQFLKQAALNSHVVKNHPSVKLPYRCGECTAKYPSADGLATHQRIYHVPSAELGLPVIDLSKQSTLNALANLGITNYVPLSSLDQQVGGFFGVPIMSVQAVQGSASSRLHALGASDILSLGPVKHIPRS